MDFSPEDLKVDAYAVSGQNGPTRRAVRVTHIPTGTVVVVDDSKSQRENKAIALARLRELLDPPLP